MAELELGALSAEDIELFKALVDEYRRKPAGGRRPRHAAPDDPGTPPWVYVVLTPASGIPAMWDETTAGGGTGSGTQGDTTAGSGTGTAVGDQGDRPGFADCQVYQLAHSTPKARPLSHPRMEPAGFSITVYNLSFTAVNGSQFVTALRDPWGDWWVPSLGYLFTGCT